MDLDLLLSSYRKDDRLKELAERVTTSRNQPIQLQGLVGSAAAFILSALAKEVSLNHLIILNDREEAAYFQNDLLHVLQALDIFYFPDSFRKPGDFEVMNGSHALLRTEALMKFVPDKEGETVKRKLLVTYPEALLEKVIAPRSFSSSMVKLKVGEDYVPDRLLERLVTLGFKSSDFVYEPGQFAMRGGILDVYSFGNDKPYRFELFGDEIESIRIFNPETQLSERKLQSVTLIPNMNLDDAVKSVSSTSEKSSIADFLPSNTIWWVKDQRYTKEVLVQMKEKLSELLKKDGNKIKVQESGIGGAAKEIDLKMADFLSSEEIQSMFEEKTVVEFGSATGGSPVRKREVLSFNFEPQPVFNRKFNLLTENLKEYKDKNYELFIFAESPKQLQRLNAIFEDLEAPIAFHQIPVAISGGFLDHDHRFLCYTDHEIFQRYHKYRIKQAYSKNKALTLKTLRELRPGDFITHVDHGIGIFSGLQRLEANGVVQEAVRIRYKDNDLLYVNINSLYKISKYSGKEGTVPKINKLGSDAWQKLKNKTKKKVKDIAKDLIKLYAARKAEKGFAHRPDTYLQHELEASFIYEDTPDQAKATEDVKRDMESDTPMDRLICGDVGFGKTEIAIRAAYKTLVDGKQAAVLVPTTILAYQHYQTFSERLKEAPCKIEYLNRFKTTKEKKEIIAALAKGDIDIIIGTHSLLNKRVKFKDLGILIIDEEQKFGVSAKEKLRQIRHNVDTLTLTATPIPRTLQFSLMGARDLSIINTAPPNRQPIQTEVHVFNEDLIRDAIYFETGRGGQVFFIHNRVKNLAEIAGIIQGLCPDLTIAQAHGKLDGKELEATILRFINHEVDVLVCTNIVESGVDIPNANTIIVNNAHHFGLSDLHQLRGRVGRSNHKAFCYLLSPPLSTLTQEARKRLQTLEQFSDLGSGFQIAMRDLDIRGAGNLLGAEQSGFIAEIGFDMYHKILNEAIQELKRSDFKEVFKEELEENGEFVSDCTIDTDQELLIPEEYVRNTTERLALYQQLEQFEGDDSLKKFRSELEDRFGPVPQQVDGLLAAIRCRMMGIDLGFEKIILKNKKVRCYFISDPDSLYFDSKVFHSILSYIQIETNLGQLKQVGKNFLLVFRKIDHIFILEEVLQNMTAVAVQKKLVRTKNPLLQ